MSNDSDVNDGRLRLTWQASPKVRVGGLYVSRPRATGRRWRDGTAEARGPRSRRTRRPRIDNFPLELHVTADVTSPLTNRLLFDGAFKHAVERAIRDRIPD